MKRLFSAAALGGLCSLFAATGCAPHAQPTQAPSVKEVQIVPLPNQVSYGTAGLELSALKAIRVQDNDTLQAQAELLSGLLKDVNGLSVPVQEGGEDSRSIVLRTTLKHKNPEAYQLQVTPEGIVIDGATAKGAFWGVQTLHQMLYRGQSLPEMQVTDAPRFSYRGVHLDVGRNFLPADYIKRFIDILALHKINTLHWHLTEDQGWRLEIKKYPKLQEVASQRKETVIGHPGKEPKFDGKPHGGYYTQEEARDIVRYAAERQITVVPEIEMPGHAQALLAAYPQMGCTGGPYEVWTTWGISDNVFCAGNEQVFTMLQDILDEVLDIFPSHYIHIGGDECPKSKWEQCPKCQARMKAEGLKDEHHLQSYFISRIERYLNSKGRDIIGWDEILEGGLAPNATLMAWRGMEFGTEAARQRHDVIMTPSSHVYFDYYQSQDYEQEPVAIGGFLPVQKVYEFEPVPADLEPEFERYIIGAQANVWREYMPSAEQTEYMLLPRLAALSEALWLPKGQKRDWQGFLPRLSQLTSVYTQKGYHFARHIFDVKGEMKMDAASGRMQVSLNSVSDAPIHYTLDGSEPTEQSPRYEGKLSIEQDSFALRAVNFVGGVRGKEFRRSASLHKGSKAEVSLSQPLKGSYAAEGPFSLVDGVRSTGSVKSGKWIGVQQGALEATLSFAQPTQVGQVTLCYLSSPGDWILPPKAMRVYASQDGKTFQEVGHHEFEALTPEVGYGQREQLLKVDATAKALRVVVERHDKLPEWHGGAGSPAYIFVDEVMVQ